LLSDEAQNTCLEAMTWIKNEKGARTRGHAGCARFWPSQASVLTFTPTPGAVADVALACDETADESSESPSWSGPGPSALSGVLDAGEVACVHAGELHPAAPTDATLMVFPFH